MQVGIGILKSRFLVFIMWIFGFVPVILISYVFSGRLSNAKVESEIVNGLVTISGLIFAFQPSYFRIPRKGSFRTIFTAIFLAEGLVLGLAGYNYATSTLDLGYLSVYTLFLASASVVYNISMTVFFILADFVMQTIDSERMCV